MEIKSYKGVTFNVYDGAWHLQESSLLLRIKGILLIGASPLLAIARLIDHIVKGTFEFLATSKTESYKKIIPTLVAGAQMTFWASLMVAVPEIARIHFAKAERDYNQDGLIPTYSSKRAFYLARCMQPLYHESLQDTTLLDRHTTRKTQFAT